MRSILARVAVVAAMISLAGCRSPKTHFYTLTATGEPGGGSSGPSLVIGPVELPRYLEKNQIVTRKGDHQVEVYEFHRWGGSLDSDFLRVMGESLGRILETDQVVLYPTRSRDADYQVAFYVDQFEAVDGKEVVLRLRWVVFDGDGSVLVSERFQTRIPITKKGVTAMVAAHSAAMAQLSQRVAETVRRAPQRSATAEETEETTEEVLDN